jgi:hypothetical protein
VYCGITNIAVRLSLKKHDLPSRLSPPPSVLINAHFDSFVTSPGGSDDGVGVAVMLETLRLMSGGIHADSRPGRLQNPVIFLFNGAEEANQQGSHGFITQHKWAPSVRALINLESIGAGGRELMFQCNSPWLAQVYADSVPFPHSSGIAHELFQLVLWRAAATDWRAFITHGPMGIAGADTAYVENGYVYHTSFDTAQAIDDGTLMNTGSNLLQFASALSAAHELQLRSVQWAEINNFKLAEDGQSIENPYDTHFIFFDALGMFQVVYSGWVITAVHFAGFMLAVAVCWLKLPNVAVLKAATKHAFYLQAMCVAVGVLVGCVYALLAPMRWYAGGGRYACLVFIPPVILTEFLLREQSLGSKLSTDLGSHEGAAWELFGLLYWAVILGVTTLLGHRGAHLPLLWTLSGAAAVMCRSVGAACMGGPAAKASKLLHTNSSVNLTAQTTPSYSWTNLLVELTASLVMLPAAALWFYQLIEGMDLVIPLLGKTGSVLIGDILVGALYGIGVGSLLRLPVLDPLLAPAVRAYVRHGRNQVRWLVVYPLMAVIVATLAYSVLSTSPYSAARPKRLWVHHLERDLSGLGRGEGKDSGLWIVGFDSLGLGPLSAAPQIPPRLDGHHRTASFRGTWFPDPAEASSRPGVTEHRQGFNCGKMNGECYLYWPYFFPVAEVLADAYYIPAAPPLSSGNPDDEANKPLVVQSESSAVIDGKRIVKISVSGPGHLNLVLRDDKSGERVLRWGMIQSTDDSAKDSFMQQSIALVETPSARMDGVHYLQIGFGYCPGSCLFRMEVEIAGEASIDMSVYGHYVLMQSKELTELATDMPAWAKGAEWTNFVSKLVSKSV